MYEPEIEVLPEPCMCGQPNVRVFFPDHSKVTYHYGNIPTDLSPRLRDRIRYAVETWRINAKLSEEMTHVQITHKDGQVCIWLNGQYFVPLDAGGGGRTCTQEHPWEPASG